MAVGAFRHAWRAALAQAARVSLTAISVVIVAPVEAQTVPGGVPVPPPIELPDPGRVQSLTPSPQELRREVPRTTDAPPEVSIDTRGALTRGPCPAALLESPLTVPLASVSFRAPEGAELAPEIARLLENAGEGLVNTTQPIRVVCDVRDRANASLAAAGYVAAVRVPEQTVEGGRLVLEVVTARIVELRVRGEPGRSRKLVERLLGRLRALSPLNTRDAERILLLAGDIPGVAVRLELSPSQSGPAGDVIGDITVERTPGTLLLNVQNNGSQQIGRYAGLARVELYGLTGLGDRTFLSGFSTSDFREQQVVQAGHDMLLTSSGLRLGGEFTYAWTRPGLEQFGGEIDLRSTALLGTLQLSYPMVRSIGANVLLTAGFDLINQRVVSGGVAINLDKLRVGFARVGAESIDRNNRGLAPLWRFGGTLELRKGTNWLDASQLGQSSGGAFPTRFEGDPQAFEIRGSYQTELRARLGRNSAYAITAAVDARGQWSNNPLLAFEELAVGNLTIGRGYDPGATSGDRAIGAKFELRVGKPQAQTRSDIAIEAMGFYDAVRIYNLDSGSTENNRTLRSYGGGARVSWGDHARLEVVYARPLDRALSFDLERASDRVLFSLVVRALPWRQ